MEETKQKEWDIVKIADVKCTQTGALIVMKNYTYLINTMSKI
jgi:hypothetical protein